MNEKWFALSISEIEKKLKTNAASGLSRKAARSAWYKSYPKTQALFIKRKKSFGKMLTETVSDFALIILLLAALFAIAFAELFVGMTVLALCTFSIIISFVLYVKTQKTIEGMNKYFLPTAKVIRGGKLYRVGFENVVVGDIIIVERGDIICGDARLITSDNLSVAMRTGKNNYTALKKQAHGVIDENTNDPKKMGNILHAGSVVQEGSGRAVIYAVGKFTYLGALTGGITEAYSENIPFELKKMKRICSKLSLISMLCILPFSIVSLLLSHLSGGGATLSSAFLTALSICASSMTQLSCTLCKLFFVNKIKDIAESNDPMAIRTTDAYDRLSEVDYLFMLDGSALTDGILHFEGIFTAEGDIKSYDHPTATIKKLLEMAALYNSAEANSLTLGLNLPERFNNAFDELFSILSVDKEAVKFKYPIKTYMPGTPTEPTDKVYFSDNGRGMILCVSKNTDIFSQCTHAVVSGSVQPISSLLSNNLRHTYNLHVSKGKTVLVFSVTSFENAGNTNGKLFLGAVVLNERTDENAVQAISALYKKKINVISFIGNALSNVPQIPTSAQYGTKAFKEDFTRHSQPVTYKFGEINTYYGLNENDIEALIDFAHSQKKSVGVIGFSDYAANVIQKSDVFISCAELIDITSANNEKELYILEMSGAKTSGSCIQSVKTQADIIIQRPNGKKGGISSLANAFLIMDTAYRNLNAFFKYMITAQIIRLITVALPMVFGSPILDARHVLFCSFVLDILVLLLFAYDNTSAVQCNKKSFKIKSLKACASNNMNLILCALLSGIFAIFLPIAASLVGIFGPYLFRVEYMFFAVIWLHLVLAYYIRYGSLKNIRFALKNKRFIFLIISVVAFVLLTIIISPLGLVFEMASHPIAYFIMSFVPAIIFSVCHKLLHAQKKL